MSRRLILGFPNDTPQTIAEDVETLKGIGFDQASFFILTPLPGSEDHIRQYMANVPMDDDFNNYDSFQPVTDHPRMSRKEWQDAYNRAWRQFYTPRQMSAALRRISRNEYWGMFRNFLWYRWSAVVEGVHPMMAGFVRHKHYASRRPQAPKLSRRWSIAYTRYGGSFATSVWASGSFSYSSKCTLQAVPSRWLSTGRTPEMNGSWNGGWMSAARAGFAERSDARRIGNG